MLTTDPGFFKHPNVIEFIKMIRYEFNQAQRPACEIVLIEEEAAKFLKVSKRQMYDLRVEGKIAFSKKGGIVYYLLSDLLDYVIRDRKLPVINKFNN